MLRNSGGKIAALVCRSRIADGQALHRGWAKEGANLSGLRLVGDEGEGGLTSGSIRPAQSRTGPLSCAGRSGWR